MKSLVLAYPIVSVAAALAGYTAAQKTTGPATSSYLNAVVVSTDVGASTLTVRARGGRPQTLHVEYAAAAQLGRLKPGDAVIVTIRLGRVIRYRRSCISLAVRFRRIPPFSTQPASRFTVITPS